jgi:hypothetical protein
MGTDLVEWLVLKTLSALGTTRSTYVTLLCRVQQAVRRRRWRASLRCGSESMPATPQTDCNKPVTVNYFRRRVACIPSTTANDPPTPVHTIFRRPARGEPDVRSQPNPHSGPIDRTTMRCRPLGDTHRRVRPHGRRHASPRTRHPAPIHFTSQYVKSNQ